MPLPELAEWHLNRGIRGSDATRPDLVMAELASDGAQWHDGELAREDDAERQAVLEAAGERVRWEQAVCHERQTLARLRAAGAPSG